MRMIFDATRRDAKSGRRWVPRIASATAALHPELFSIRGYFRSLSAGGGAEFGGLGRERVGFRGREVRFFQ